MSDFISRDAVKATKRMAERLGLGAVEPQLVAISEHVVLHLSPAPVVARVRRAGSGEAAMRRELDVIRHLSARGAPVLAPLASADAGPHAEDGFIMTLWPFVPHKPADGENERHQVMAADALRLVHRAFIDYPGDLPTFEEKIESCHALLRSAAPALSAEDRRYLLDIHDEIVAGLRDSSLERVPIHGDAGFHNLFLTGTGPLWTDFEAACVGPASWDFAALGYEDEPLMMAARSFCVSVWCWAQIDLPGKREAAEYHLDLLKKG
jgi:Ser/Thr protein kinase RdoA (MazF antagonist)